MRAKTITPWEEIAVRRTANPITAENDGNWWVTLTNIDYEIDGITYIVPAGYVTDFGSIPKFARSFIDVADESITAFIFHDYIYPNTSPYYFTRKSADLAMVTIARAAGQDTMEAYVAYWSVRLVGWYYHGAERDIRMDPTPKRLIDKICKDNSYYPIEDKH